MSIIQYGDDYKEGDYVDYEYYVEEKPEQENKFSFSTVVNFDQHINQSIPGYKDLINDVKSFAKYFIEPQTNIVDIGCSTGIFIKSLAQSFRDERLKIDNHQLDMIADTKFIGVEKEKNLSGNFRLMERESSGILKFRVCDIADHLGESDILKNMSLCTSIFTLQFLPRLLRENLIKKVHDNLNPGGAFIFSEKIYSSSSRIQDMMTFIYYDYKKRSFTSDEILVKELSLREIMRPVMEEDIFDQIKTAGFKQYDVFFKRYNFMGVIAIKG